METGRRGVPGTSVPYHVVEEPEADFEVARTQHQVMGVSHALDPTNSLKVATLTHAQVRACFEFLCNLNVKIGITKLTEASIIKTDFLNITLNFTLANSSCIEY